METKKKIFIVDDDITIHEALVAILPPNEYEVIHAYDGQNVVERVEDEQPDLVILDIIMPMGDGRDICRDIRKNPKTKDIKILMLSAMDEQSDRILGLELGADNYIPKPFYPPLIAGKIKEMCGID